MPRSTLALLLAGAVALSACFEEEPKTYDKDEFPAALADAVCTYIFNCCDSAEIDTLIGGGGDQSVCTSAKRAEYVALFQDADPDQWNAGEATSCLDKFTEAFESGTCPRAFDVDTELDKCDLVTSTKQAGDLCQSSWDCSTKFCKSGVCANPLPDGSQCAAGDRCATGLKCVTGVCQGLQPDGAACTDSSECMSGACGGGKCVVEGNYTCDGK